MYKQLDNICLLSKNLYNSGLYTIKQEFLKNGKWIRYHELNKLFKDTNQQDYRSITNNSAQQTLILLDNNIKGYFHSIKKWKQDKTKFLDCPQFPKYKDKICGRIPFIYTYVQIQHKDNYIIFPKKEKLLPLKTKISKEQIKQVRIIPKNGYYVIEVVYEQQELIKEKNNNWLSIDLGVNNLASCTNNLNTTPFIINGKPLKSINHYYNKKRGLIQQQLEKNHKKIKSKRLSKLTLKRNNKIHDYLHKSSKYIVNYCVKNNIDNIVVGKNDGWKQETNIGKRNNQNFHQIPFDKFIGMLKYKSNRQGLGFIEINESYTSKCSSIDLENIEYHKTYIGKRIKRGLFRTKNGSLINADINGSYNILRKATGDVVIPTSTGFVYNPLKINL